MKMVHTDTKDSDIGFCFIVVGVEGTYVTPLTHANDRWSLLKDVVLSLYYI